MNDFKLIFCGTFGDLLAWARPSLPAANLIITDHELRKKHVFLLNNYDHWNNMDKSMANKMIVDLLCSNKVPCKVTDVGVRLGVVVISDF